ncbi:MAG: GMC family oxidoreductase N-terminal domain-containing protein, partial [Pseudomonadota bacterium]|nr:GMC family oxidoreductase N-terminal domain-containing protein [Pseudomonadota bacterium]
MDKTFDYIIVGAGSAGCVLANRLSADGKHSVLLLEAGGSDRNILIAMPTALSYPMASKTYNWGYDSDPEPFVDNRRITCPRGKGLGGTSSINGMVYVRGHACDFDEWEALGAEGWGYADCLPYFKRSETWQGGEDAYRGGSGPLGVSGGNNMARNPLYQAFIDAGVEAGYPRTDDYNGECGEGFGQMHMTVAGGVRESTSRAYLRPAMARANLTVMKHVLVDRLILDGMRVTGLVGTRGGKPIELKAGKEVILSAGSIASPMILQRSGIGPAALLSRLGITPQHDLPGVGQNLQDHLEVYFQYHCQQPVSLNSKLNLFSKFWIGARWFFFKSGLGATNHFESCAFIRSRAGLKSPDIQYHFLPAAMRYD